MSSSSKWVYAATSPYPEQGGTKQIKVDLDDFFQCQESFRSKRLTHRKVTNPYYEEGLTTFKEVVPTAGQINAEMRKAGYHSNKISAAAMAYVLKDAGRNFQNLQRVWAGLGSGYGYLEMSQKTPSSVSIQEFSLYHFRNAVCTSGIFYFFGSI